MGRHKKGYLTEYFCYLRSSYKSSLDPPSFDHRISITALYELIRCAGIVEFDSELYDEILNEILDYASKLFERVQQLNLNLEIRTALTSEFTEVILLNKTADYYKDLSRHNKGNISL